MLSEEIFNADPIAFVDSEDEQFSASKANQTANHLGPSPTINKKQLSLLSLHDDVFQEILSHLSYDEVAKLRLVISIINSFYPYIAHITFSLFDHKGESSL